MLFDIIICCQWYDMVHVEEQFKYVRKTVMKFFRVCYGPNDHSGLQSENLFVPNFVSS